jgi:predicted branched-subunit amino acid permease
MHATLLHTTSHRERAEHPFVLGVRATLPWLVGIVPFGVVIGARAADAAIPTAAGWLTGPLIFAGSAQVVTIEMLDDGAAPLVAIVAALAVNLRLVLYSAAMAPYWHGTPRWFRAVAPAFLVDPSLAVGLDGYREHGATAPAHRHYLGGVTALFLAWVAAITAGAVLGAALPPALHLELVVPLYLLGEVVPRLPDRAVRAGVVAAAGLGVVSAHIPLHLGVLAAIAAGVTVSLAIEGRSR